MIPTYNGLPIFGYSVSMTTVDVPRDKQINSYFGLSGLETLDGGSRGRWTHAKGLLSGNSAGLLAAAEMEFRSFNDGFARVLVDTLGSVWQEVRLDGFQPIGSVRQSPAGVYFRAYYARFFHLE